MGADDRGLQGAFSGTRLRQGYGEVAGDTGLIVQRQFVAFDRDAPEGGLNSRGQCRDEVLPSRDQRLARQNKFLGEPI